jgi:hypothetical protein
MDLKRFAVRIRTLGENVQNNATALVRKVALSVDATVVSATPVDTGRARSNWQVEIGRPARGVIDAHVPGSEGSTSGPNTQIALALGAAAISTYQSGETIHLTNNLPYIGALNDGHSAQAPAGFVQTAVLDGALQIKDAKLLVTSNNGGVLGGNLGRIG